MHTRRKSRKSRQSWHSRGSRRSRVRIPINKDKTLEPYVVVSKSTDRIVPASRRRAVLSRVKRDKHYSWLGIGRRLNAIAILQGFRKNKDRRDMSGVARALKDDSEWALARHKSEKTPRRSRRSRKSGRRSRRTRKSDQRSRSLGRRRSRRSSRRSRR